MDKRFLAALEEHPRDLGAGYLEYGPYNARVILPAKYEVCCVCEGKGAHVNLSVDAYGLTQQDFDEDPEFADNYFGGAYNIRCVLCEGQRVIPVPDEQRCTPEQLQTFHTYSREQHRMAIEDYNERRTEALMSGDSLSNW